MAFRNRGKSNVSSLSTMQICNIHHSIALARRRHPHSQIIEMVRFYKINKFIIF